MASFATFCLRPHSVKDSVIKSRLRVRVQCLGVDDSKFLSFDSFNVNGNPRIKEKDRNEALKVERNSGEKPKNVGIGRLKPGIEKEKVKDAVSKNLEVMWDDGYGTKTVRDYLDEAKELISPDEGPPRWFCPVECGEPLKGSPVLLFLPGIDGVGLGLILHHKALGKVFEVRCLHIPVYNRTPFEQLVKFVEKTVRLEHASSPNKPIYLVGDSFGGCLALAVAARNPKIDLVVILVNPATSFGRSQLQPLPPILEALTDGLHNSLVPYLLSFVMGDPIKMAMADKGYNLPPSVQFEQLSSNLTAMLPDIVTLAEIFPKETLLWKLKLLKSAAAYANSRLHAVKAEVLVIASGKDNIFPSGDEAKRLKNLLPKCNIRYFKDSGHAFLLEDGLNLLTIMKGTFKYRRSRQFDIASDYVPPSMSESRYAFDKVVGLLRFATGSATFSTLDDGRIVKGLAGVPTDGPVIFVGYHMLMGLEIYSFVEEILREKKILVRGIEHPEVFTGKLEIVYPEFSIFDWTRVMGAIPASPSNLFKLLSAKSHVLLYPGGAREALHFKGEQYKLFWPDQPEFVRMAAKFGATIVPFGTVGEDDITELVLDYNDLIKIPLINDYIRESTRNSAKMRDESKGEVANQKLFIPGLLPKVPGRIYFLFGKPIKTTGRKDILEDREGANKLYLQVKSEIEHNIAYLLKKREEDPYRNIIDRTIYCMLHSPLHEIPAFRP